MNTTWKISHATTCEGFGLRGRLERFGTEATANQVFHNCVIGCVLDSVPDPVITSLRAQFELKKFERRELVASMCLQGITTRMAANDPETIQQHAKMAALYADALIEELGEPFL